MSIKEHIRYWKWWWSYRHIGKPKVQLADLGLTPDQYAVVEAYISIAEIERDDSERKASERDRQYQEIRTILEVYADQAQWLADGKGRYRFWRLDEPGWRLAQQWVKDQDVQR